MSVIDRPYKPGRYWKDGSRPYHARASCQGHPCPWHAPSRHKMRTWPRVIRFDKWGMVERTCPHGVGHPDPDSVALIWEFVVAGGPRKYLETHGCDGCCSREVTPAVRTSNGGVP